MAVGYKVGGFVVDVIKEFLKEVVSKGLVSGVVLPVKNTFGENYSFVFTKDESVLDTSSPIAPVMSYQGARILSRLTRKGSLSKKAIAVLKPCELRAARELHKINQVDIKSFITVSFDCPGVYSLKNYIKEAADIEERFADELKSFSISNSRPLCSVCEDFTGELADIEVQFAGEDEVYFVANTEEGRALLEALGKGQELEERKREFVEKVKRERANAREGFREEFGSFVGTPEKLLDVLSACINCHNCRSVCPICYCRECFFDSTALRVSPQLYIERAERKGGLRFLPDTLLFHLGRMNHMSFSCVSCGMCEDACPMDVPVGRIFSLVSERVRAVFNYKPGVNLDEPSPVLDYRTEELEEFEVPYFESRKG